MMIINGTEATLVIKPNIIRVPQTISKDPVKYAQNEGLLNPIVKNLPVPRSCGNKNFCIPSVKNIRPTVSLTRIALLSLTELIINLLNPLFVFMSDKILFSLYVVLHFKRNITRD